MDERGRGVAVGGVDGRGSRKQNTESPGLLAIVERGLSDLIGLLVDTGVQLSTKVGKVRRKRPECESVEERLGGNGN